MRVRIFNTYETAAPFYRDLVARLIQEGFEVELMLSNLDYRAGRLPLEERFGNPRVTIRRTPGRRGLVTRSWQKLLATVTYYLFTPLQALLGRSVDLNLFLSQPPLFSLWGYIFRLFRGQPYICLVMDIYPDVLVQNHVLAANSLTNRLLSTLSGYSLAQADRVIAIGRCMAALLKSRGVPENQIHVIPNWVNDREVWPVPRDDNQLRCQLGVTGEFVVLYSGNLGVSHYFDDILEAARRLRHLPDIQFVFIGDGVRRKEIESALERDGLTNILLLPFQPTERLAESLSLGDVHFVSLRSGFEGLVVPSKAYSALGTGRPLIYQGEAHGEIALMISEEDIGSVVPLADPDTLTQVIFDYYEDRDCLHAKGARARAVNSTKYRGERALSEYVRVIHDTAKSI